jgi:hypothetical protein
MSWGTVERPADATPEALTVAAIDGHPFGPISFTGDRWALADVRLVAPILPSKIVAIGKNYADHAREMGGEAPSSPVIFLKPSTAVIGSGDVIRVPPDSSRVDHEAELAVVIGRPARRPKPSRLRRLTGTRSARSTSPATAGPCPTYACSRPSCPARWSPSGRTTPTTPARWVARPRPHR